jgi:hypothetical protein
MRTNDLWLALGGVAAWVVVALVSVVAVRQEWDQIWGFFPVAAAVIVAWAVGEYVTGGVRIGGTR